MECSFNMHRKDSQTDLKHPPSSQVSANTRSCGNINIIDEQGDKYNLLRRVIRTRGKSNSNMGDKKSVKGKSIDDVYALIVGHKTHLDGIEAQLKDIKESLEFTQKTVEENKEQISALQQENAGLKREVSDLSKKMEKLDIRQEADERRSREWSVCIYGIKREQNEDTKKVISELISGHNLDGIVTVKRADTIIEHCHRLRQSKKEQESFFHSRPQRFKILREAKIKINRSEANNNIFMVEDLTASDHALKSHFFSETYTLMCLLKRMLKLTRISLSSARATSKPHPPMSQFLTILWNYP